MDATARPLARVQTGERPSPLGQAFYGAPAPLKAAIGASMAGLGAFADHILKPERQK